MSNSCEAVRGLSFATTVLCGALLSFGVAAGDPGPAPGGSGLQTVPKVVEKDSQGVVTQVVPEKPVPASSGGGNPGAAAVAHAEGVGEVFGAKSVGSLVVDAVFPVGSGSTVRLRQEIDSVPVFGASVAQSLSADGSLLSATGALTQKFRGAYPQNPSTPPAEVFRTAVRAVADQSHVPADKLSVVEQRANWYDPKLAAVTDADSQAVPAYRIDVAGSAKWTVFVDATDTGRVLDSWSDKQHLNRVVCDADSADIDTDDDDSETTQCGGSSTFTPDRTEGKPPVSVADVDNIYTYLGDADAFYNKYTPLADLSDFIGYDTGDGHGKALRATVRICTSEEREQKQQEWEPCPYRNAFWTGDHMAYGAGLATQDITGHELTHGVTQHTSGLIYRDESGAINESMSDLFGELINITMGKADSEGRWKIGDGSALGVIRDMKDPTARRNPDTYKATYWYTGPSQSAFVHINSGVGNKTAQLITDGGSLNGQTVTGIGIEKVAGLYWTVQTLLPSDADYATLSSTLTAACKQNVTNQVAGTTTADCAEVANATKATKLPTLNRT